MLGRSAKNMPRSWKERLDTSKHSDMMSTPHVGGITPPEPRDNLIEKWVYFVLANGYQLHFVSVEQVKEALDYFAIKNHGSTIQEGINLEHYWQPWHGRLPKGMHSQRSKKIWIPALQKLLDDIDSDSVDIR